MHNISGKLKRLLALLYFAVNTAQALDCPNVDIDVGKTPIFLQFNDELPPYSYAFVEDGDQSRHKLLVKDSGYESPQEQGKLYLILANSPLAGLADFEVSINDGKGADFIHNPLPRPLQAARFDDFADATVCWVAL